MIRNGSSEELGWHDSWHRLGNKSRSIASIFYCGLSFDCQHCSSHMTKPRRNDERVEQKTIQLNKKATTSMGSCISCSKPYPTLGIVVFLFQPSRSRNAAPSFSTFPLEAQAPEAKGIHQKIGVYFAAGSFILEVYNFIYVMLFCSNYQPFNF